MFIELQTTGIRRVDIPTERRSGCLIRGPRGRPYGREGAAPGGKRRESRADPGPPRRSGGGGAAVNEQELTAGHVSDRACSLVRRSGSALVLAGNVGFDAFL